MGTERIPVVAIFDVGKTNKKLFLFDAHYNVVYERSARFLETTDEDGEACENLESLRLSVFDSLHQVFRKKEFAIKGINFASYGASLVYLDEQGLPLAPLYNYLKSYPSSLAADVYARYGGEDEFALQTASPALGSLNSGLQLYRIKKQQPAIFAQLKYALHLPQYLSFLVSGEFYSDMTSIGCHTALWDFQKNDYHAWIHAEGMAAKLAPIVQGGDVFKPAFPGSSYLVGSGLHDSSSALIPYLINFHEPFVLISTGTWCISFNPFNAAPLTSTQLKSDCLFYLSYQGVPVKASRLFAGNEHEQQIKRIADHFDVSTIKLRNLEIDWKIVTDIQEHNNPISDLSSFSKRDLHHYANYAIAYHALMLDLIAAQIHSTRLVLESNSIKRVFVDGGFSKNSIYMHLLARAFPEMEVYAASMAQATAVGAALVIHDAWNTHAVPSDIIELRFYRN